MGSACRAMRQKWVHILTCTGSWDKLFFWPYIANTTAKSLLVLSLILVIVNCRNMDSRSTWGILNMAISTTNNISANWNTSWKWHKFACPQSFTQKTGRVYMKMVTIYYCRYCIHMSNHCLLTYCFWKSLSITALVISGHLHARKFKGGICWGGHLAVTCELLYLRIFS